MLDQYPDVSRAAASERESMTAELIIGTDQNPETGLWPWQAQERENWFFCRWNSTADPSHFNLGQHYRRTASAHAVGRAILTQVRAAGSTATCVEVYEYDSDTNTSPAVDTQSGELVEVGNSAALAVVTDPAPVGPALEEFEQALESTRMLQRRYESARAAMTRAMTRAYRSATEVRSANWFAAQVKGAMSRPTVLKVLTVDEDEADL
jgi:hypothetical protein